MSEPACLRVPLSEYPGLSPFVLDWVTGQPRATRFLPRETGALALSPAAPASSGGAAPAGVPLAQALIESNRRWGLFVGEQVRRWASGGTLTIMAGQQVGFAGGPLYTLAKLASLVKMKRELEAGGTPVTAFFWMATEDHDFDEVAQLSVPAGSVGREVNQQLNLLSIRTRRAVESRTVVGRVPIPEPLIAEFLTLYAMERPSWLREGITFGDSFAELIGSIFGSEVILVDSLLPELRRAGAPLFGAITARWDDLERALDRRSAELRDAGYTPQVVPRERERYTLLFEVDDHGDRHALEGPRNVPPERVSTSALTRPLLQEFVFRPDVFLGGPAEVSYYAQIVPLHEMLGVPMPRVALRGHALVAPQRVLRFMERYRITAHEIFTSTDALLAEREPEAVAEVRKIAARTRAQLMENIERIAQLALPADHALARAFNRSVGHIEYHVARLAERAIKGLVRKDRERYAAARELVATLYPDGHVQDRIVGWFPWWRQHGQYLIDRIVDEIEPDAASFEIVGL